MCRASYARSSGLLICVLRFLPRLAPCHPTDEDLSAGTPAMGLPSFARCAGWRNRRGWWGGWRQRVGVANREWAREALVLSSYIVVNNRRLLTWREADPVRRFCLIPEGS